MKKIVSSAVAAAIALVPWTATAQSSGFSVRFFWYADETQTTIVGEYIHYCNGQSYQWGYATPYPGEEYGDC